MKKWHYHVISNTHWDREWRYPFQVYRLKLVGMMDRLLNLLEDTPEYRAFFLDSQTVILEDYLEIRPENEKRIAALVKAGRLQIGPWYTLPDQWCCFGEALVRNLLMGHKTAQRFGPVSKIGYTPFSNGQISQLPQLYNGFGIDSCFFYRGVGKHVAKPEFIWEGADASQVFAFKFGDYARYNYYYLVYRPGLLGRFLRDRDYIWDPEEIPYHVATDASQDLQYGWLNQKLTVHEENLKQALEQAKECTKPDTATSHLLFMMGHDHSYPAREETELIDALQKHIDPDKEELIHSSLKEYLEAFREEAGKLELLKGEMRHSNKEGLWTNLFAQILSCRLYLKQENARVNARVLYSSEPLAAISWITGSPYPRAFFDVAWKKLLINQAHDAIGGCSVDPVHKEMQARWSEVEALSDTLSRNAMAQIASCINGSQIPENQLQLTVFNPLPFKRSGVASFIIDFPTDDPEAQFSLKKSDGTPIPLQLIAREPYNATIEGAYELSMPFPVQRFSVKAFLQNLPALGYEAFTITPGETSLVSEGSLAKSNQELENEFLNVKVNPNGSLCVTDKKTGRIFQNLCLFEDEAEFGDPWKRIVPENDKPLVSHTSLAESRIAYNGSLESALEISLCLSVPREKQDEKTRSSELAEIPITLIVSLQKNSPLLDVKVNLTNKAKDHRLRILFPTGIKQATHSFAHGQFDVLKRPITLHDSKAWLEPPYPTHPMWNFVCVDDRKQGFSVINNGLIEYEVKDDTERTIAITLLRSFGKFVFDRPTPGSQALQDHRFHFCVYPHKGGWREAGVFHYSSRFTAPALALESAPTKGNLSQKTEFIRVFPESMVFSGIKQSQDQKFIVLRLWNPTSGELEVEIETGFSLKKAQLLSLEEIPIQKLDIADRNKVKFFAKAKKIITLGLHFEPGGILQ